MEITGLSDLRPRSVWDLVDDAFDLYREHFTLMAGIAATLYVPGYLVYLAWITTSFGQLFATSRTPGDPSEVFVTLFGGLALTLPLFGFVYILQGGATAAAVAECLAHRPIGIGPALRRVWKRFWPLLGASLLVGLMAFLGVCTLYVGTIIVLIYCAFVPQAAVLENRSAFASCRRSRDIARRAAGKIFGMFALLGVLGLLLSGGLQGLIELAALALPKAGDATAQEFRKFLITQVTTSLASVLLAPLSPIAMTLLYYDLRVRREGLDMESEAARIGFALAPDPFGGVADPKLPRAPRGAAQP